MSAENELPKVSRDSEGNLVIPQPLFEMLELTESTAHKINLGAARLAKEPQGAQHLLSCMFFTDNLRKEVNWAIKEGTWGQLRVYFPSIDSQSSDLIKEQLMDSKKPPTVLERNKLGAAVQSFTYFPTIIPTLWIQEIVAESYGQTYTTRTLYSQTALLDLQ